MGCNVFTQSVFFTFSVPTLSGEDYQLSEFSGKQIVVTILPVTRTTSDSNSLATIDSLSKEFVDSIKFIGVLSYDDGYQDDSMNVLLPWYQSILSEQVFITGGMNTKKSSAYQHPLFTWLTNADQNGHFDDESKGSNQKFLITATGEEFGLISPEIPLTRELLQQITRQ